MSALVQINPTTRNSKTSGLILASKGVTTFPISIPVGATSLIQEVAADLARVLTQMTGAKFVVTTGGTTGIKLGTLRNCPSPDLNEALQVNLGFEGTEAFAIRPSNNSLLIIGASDLGVSNGVYRFLRELGCRWLGTHPNWEVIPSIPTLVWNKEITDRPQILSRSIWYKTEYDFEADRTPTGSTPTKDFALWKRRNMHHDALQITAGHMYHNVVLANKAAFGAGSINNPLINGVRVAMADKPTFNQPDLAQPAVRKMFLDYARSYFRARPTATMISMESNDGGGWSQSPEFKALGSISDAVFGLANEVAKMLQQEFPGKMVGLLSYREHGEPPTFPLEPNVYVQITGNAVTTMSRSELVSAWSSKHKNLGFYDYYGPYYWHFDQPGMANAASKKYISERIRSEVNAGGTSVSAESSGSQPLFAHGHYIAAHMMWDITQDSETLFTDFLEKGFGPAADSMRKYYELCDPEKRPVVSRQLISKMVKCIQQALIDATGNTAVLNRLMDYQHYLRYLELDWSLRRMPISAPYQERETAFIKLFSHLWKIRYTYAIHWGLASQGLWQRRAESSGMVVIKDGVKSTVNPLLEPKNNLDNPWKNNAPYTQNEITANFQSTLAYFESDNLLEVTYTKDLVPVKWEGTVLTGGIGENVVTRLTVQTGTASLMVYTKGDPIVFWGLAGTANKKQSPRAWQVVDQNGEIIQEGQIRPILPAGSTQITVPVPEPGLYEIRLTDDSGYVTLNTFGKTCVSLVEPRINQKPPYQPRFFYVPKGTRFIQYLLDYLTATHKLIGPDGTTVFEGVNDAQTYRTIPVPIGMDGKVWRLDTGGINTLRFTNIPPYIAPSPERLLVPREVALADDLTILP